MKSKTQQKCCSVLVMLFGVFYPGQKICAASDATAHNLDTNMSGDPSVVNAWYFDGCLAGAASGYVVGFLLARDEIQRDKGLEDVVKKFDWPCGARSVKEIQNELDALLFVKTVAEKPQRVRRMESSAQVSDREQLTIRRAGIYSTYYAAVREGWKDALNDTHAELQTKGNKFLRRYVEEHPAGLPETFANDLYWKTQIQIID